MGTEPQVLLLRAGAAVLARVYGLWEELKVVLTNEKML